MKNRGIFLLISVALIMVFIFFQNGSVTYGDKIQELIGGREVEKIEIRLDDGTTVAVIEDQETIDEIVEKPRNMNLEETEEIHDPVEDFYLDFHTREGNFLITVNEAVIGRLYGDENASFTVLDENILYEIVNDIAEEG
ncbi:hypothetical protein [Isachenkonia alkalipeptolytica]|uniref:Uncharacterized protein n=1 Tax=Isachenkonia alkalipeptolytica TaxID=2565777 RepID=A0AA43XKA7_9CLOT|nr:hypothetical protein [Isachenkonia alkalipeptolytica]NBG87874.1 hypothetical protein [Isachenkonia alkalipeptolytica]